MVMVLVMRAMEIAMMTIATTMIAMTTTVSHQQINSSRIELMANSEF